ncbi:MAG TPA: hypothetical protein VF832_20720 [Longimicrobiales bacterium]
MRLVLLAGSCAVALLGAIGCDDYHIAGPNARYPEPVTDVAGAPHWVLEGFSSSGQPVGYPVAELTWTPPPSWDQEVFRVYSRRSGQSSYYLVGTIGSCSVNGCVYRDRDVSAGRSYDYYVSTYDDRRDLETESTVDVTVRIPSSTSPATPLPDTTVSLDGSAFVRWRDGGVGKALWKYLVYITRVDAAPYNYRVGETDGASFLDGRAANGHVYAYRVAAVDSLEHVSALSSELVAAPRPDAYGELIYSWQTGASQSGFRFQADENTNPIVAGSAASAQWRFEAAAAGWRIVPLGGTQLLQYPNRTTALSCGPGADAGCRAATRAPATGYQASPLTVTPEYSYVFRVTGDDGQTHYGVLRVAILGSDGSGHDLMIFDWAYQLLPNDVRLSTARTGTAP